ncbi:MULTISPECIES: response regulator transcription factor [Caldilinea]|jgi:DNA-binding response OmpR family regulator|uniref:Sensory transduction protein RegX3 n=1 Tax=Caldilinea aerophila (strain DSM 14535 / JCM 11387 / NBRC 104270 / STL-6-O1) TaxID=926550 RepID=I0I707_CALAS|nr:MULTISPECIES: response regulator transcription factor [Caldilinea]MBO9395026.1 response regulator transcription factor [Caldilinea sp.]BAM01045.1 putative two-component response regulator [Caldilinea aerophila DSM 14535 = NBRC 104270]GIV72382.1 MAG: DNA-binding response regulator [Caldilinea sp.]
MKILLVEDDLALSDVVSFTLRRAGFEVIPVYDGAAALTAWESTQPALVVLDLNLPKQDGFTVCRQIRSQSQTPIIILSVRGGDDAVVRALELGADDYIVKPFSPAQLVARVRAVLRRAGAGVAGGQLEHKGWVLDPLRHEVRGREGKSLHLTPLETRLLEALMLNAGQVLTAETLIQAVWGAEGASRTMLKQLVYRLRAKLETIGAGDVIETVPGVGYAFGT